MALSKVLGTKIPLADFAKLERYLREKKLTRSEFCRIFLAEPLADIVNDRDPLPWYQSAEAEEPRAG